MSVLISSQPVVSRSREIVAGCVDATDPAGGRQVIIPESAPIDSPRPHRWTHSDVTRPLMLRLGELRSTTTTIEGQNTTANEVGRAKKMLVMIC